MKIAFGMIVFNGDFVLEECLKSVYPYANQILVSEGPVKYWQEQGHKTSFDKTNKILESFPDPENKITVVHGQYNEKDDQCNAYVKHLKDDNDYIWNLDCDEIFKPEDIETIISLLEEHQYTSVGFKSLSFYGGFEKQLTGFEENSEFLRVRKIYPGSYWATHRPPTIRHTISNPLPEKHLDFNELANSFGIRMYHYSYVFPRQVKEKIAYYKSAVSRQNCIDDYYNQVYYPWVMGDEKKKQEIEDKYNGVHEFKIRESCMTKTFDGEHPQIILDNMEKLKENFNKQLKELQI